MFFYSPKNNLAELLKILSDCGDNSLRITHYDDRRSPLNP